MQDMKLCASPPHHCELNPIEMVWGVLKNYVATENKDMTIKSVEELFRKRHAELKDQPEFWKKCVEKVKRIEEDYRKSDISVDIQVEKLCVELHPDSSSDSDELECLSSETSDIESQSTLLLTCVFYKYWKIAFGNNNTGCPRNLRQPRVHCVVSYLFLLLQISIEK